MADSKKIIIEHAVKELEKAIDSFSSGKKISFPKHLKKILNIVEAAEAKMKESKLDEHELDSVFDKVARDLTKEK